jgi:hypothetical protein
VIWAFFADLGDFPVEIYDFILPEENEKHKRSLRKNHPDLKGEFLPCYIEIKGHPLDNIFTVGTLILPRSHLKDKT